MLCAMYLAGTLNCILCHAYLFMFIQLWGTAYEAKRRSLRRETNLLDQTFLLTTELKISPCDQATSSTKTIVIVCC